ncbi:hypothetical protein J3T26_23495 [Salmonella enterica]|uniref:hypothetical protein n=1 Tax=Salmonella enterica TaxID=28901 RepID=UPI0021D51186|nr:hypothetical protein [Salmonella enterica]MCU7123639.1 hypothetical protein [Salmonella enterica]
MIRTLVVDYTHATQEPNYTFNANILGGRLLKVAFKDALVSPWISTISALPREYELVLITNGHVFDIANYIDGQFHVADCVYPASAIDWWMPVPEAPDDEDY